MKKVLIVDDEEDMLWMLQRNLDNGIPNIETFAAQSGNEALDILKETKIDLVITDINMPGMSGLELLTEVSNRWKDTKVIIMTAYPSNAFANKAKKEGAVKFVEKPFDINDMRNIVETALGGGTVAQNSSSGIALVDIIQFNGLAKSTSALKITTTDQKGMVYFREGKVVHASFGEESGETAFFQILEVEGAELQNLNGIEPPMVTMGKSVESLMLEAAVRKDEEEVKQASGRNVLSFQDEKASPSSKEPAPARQYDEINTITTPEESEPTEDDNMTEIQKILAEFTNIDGVHTACLVGRDGFLLDSLARTGIDAEMIGAIASSGFGSAETMGNQLGQGELSMTMLEYTEGPVLFAPVGEEAFLVIVADKDTNLGWIRIAIKKNAAKIEKVASV
ncbi:MAG: response regulator [Desulfopila sp.]|jgi:predicted regulator of Ras-like GTPase activity (Roadblock/LC7/MglB family)/CheY-like chemotaxis protein|nr:response regulator [Desulfopila sp.]